MASRALVVAVPDTDVPNLPALPGVRGDALEVRTLLQANGLDTIITHEGGCTVDTLTNDLLTLRRQTQPGDLALMYFSGHGYLLADANNDELDPWDECLVLTDALLRDDWFHDVFWPEVAVDTRWVACIDACHSATIVQGWNMTLNSRHRRSPDGNLRTARGSFSSQPLVTTSRRA